MARRPVVALLTDFGLEQHYVGVMKGVIASIAPDAQLIDISHAVPPQDVLAAQWLLRASVRCFPAGTVFLAVVDPGVGTSRRPLGLRSAEWLFVGPDNGLFTPWLDSAADVVELRETRFRLPEVSATFHGRDIFAPAAAFLARGEPLTAFGPSISDPVRLEPPTPAHRDDGTMVGEIVCVDHFGNLITNLSARRGLAEYRGQQLPVRETYGSAETGQLLALIGSEGQIEIAVRDGNAAAQLSAKVGEPVLLRAAQTDG